MPAFELPPLTLEILQGNIADQAVDAVVNAANDHLWMGSGVAGALKARGGAEIEAEAIGLGPVPVGEAVVTSGGRLPAHWVIHAVVMGQDLQTDARAVASAARSALRRAAEVGAHSIALPALGTGVGGFPLEQCASLLIDAVKEAAIAPAPPARVAIVLYDRVAFETFARVATARLGPPAG